MKRLLLITMAPSVVIACIFYMVFIRIEPIHEIGRIQVNGMPNVYFDLEQDNDFDMVRGISYGISTENHETIASKTSIVGTHDHITNTADFYASSVDSIIYLTWGDTTAVYAVYNLASGSSRSNEKTTWEETARIQNELLNRLKDRRPYLVGNWEK